VLDRNSSKVSWLDTTLDQLAKQPALGYFEHSTAAAEPTALAALAFIAHGRTQAAEAAATPLVGMQAENGEVGVRPGEWPGWPTSLAILAWSAVGNSPPVGNALRGVPSAPDGVPSAPPVGADTSERHRVRSLQPNIHRAATWLLANRGKAIQRSDNFGHNSELVGWAYAEGTHSWVEPTALAVMALAAAGQMNHPAVQEGLAVLLDRQLPGGGYNYGNTYVLGQLIRPHVEPTGIVLLALGRGAADPGRLKKSLAWLERSIGPDTTPLSLAWALLGLQAHGLKMSAQADWLAAAAERVEARDRSPHKLALLALAAKGWPA
jgi:hypothetical protein